MVQKILAVIDPTDRSDGDLLSWDDGASTHVYVAPTGAASAAVMCNEFMNFPSLENADGAQPEWWEEEDANATLTEEDVAGESITETWERTLKVVTTADKYAYQTFTYADQPRIKSGRTVSCRVAVWSVSGVTARVRLQSTAGSLAVGTSTAAAWTIITLDGVVLDGTAVSVRLEVNNGTAYFVPIAFGIGDSAPHELPPRGLRFKWKDAAAIKSWTGLADEATWTDIDVTSATSPLAVMAHVFAWFEETADKFILYYRRNGSSEAIGAERAKVDPGTTFSHADNTVILDDQQIFEYYLDRTAGAGTLAQGTLACSGYWEWT